MCLVCQFIIILYFLFYVIFRYIFYVFYIFYILCITSKSFTDVYRQTDRLFKYHNRRFQLEKNCVGIMDRCFKGVQEEW